MQKPRLLITITFSFSVRYLVRTGMINALKRFCKPVVGLYWNEEGLVKMLQENDIEVVTIPAVYRGVRYNDCRKKINYLFFNRFLKRNSKIINAYMESQLPFSKKMLIRVRRTYNILKYGLFKNDNALFKLEKCLLKSDTNLNEYIEWLEALNLYAVFSVTPFHKQEDILLSAAKSLGLKMVTSILSFDNPTKRGWIPLTYDRYFVWNERNKNEILQLYSTLNNKQIHVCGAPQFDFYFESELILPISKWRTINGINTSRPVIFYSGGPADLFPNEIQYLKDLLFQIDAGLIHNNPLILFRSHPADNIDRWIKAFPGNRNIVFQSSWGKNNDSLFSDVSKFEISNLCSTLFYTDVHVSLCSTMTVDGSAFDKPQIAPYYDANNRRNERRLRQLYFQEHYQDIMDSGALQLVPSKDAWPQVINRCMSHPEEYKKHRRLLLKKVIRFSDGKSTDRVVDAIEKFLSVRSEVFAK